MELKVFLRVSKEKLVLTLVLFVLSFIFLVMELAPLAIYTDWIILIIGPVFKLLGVYSIPSVLELGLFFFGMFFSGYILSCFIVEKREMLGSFFRPNKLKIGLFVVLVLLANIPGIGTLDTGEKESIKAIDYANDGFGGEVLRTYYSLNPVLWFPFWYSLSFIESGELMWGVYKMFDDTIPIVHFFEYSMCFKLLYSMPAAIFYWYLLSCLLYMGYRRVKG